MKIRDNETGEVFEYGTNIHHALMISANGGCLTFENLQNGDGSLESGNGGYSFVLDDGKTPEESSSPDAVNGATYANIGGFHGDNTKNDGWIPCIERMPTKKECENNYFWIMLKYNASPVIAKCAWIESENKKGNDDSFPEFFIDQYPQMYTPSKDIIMAWKISDVPEPYHPERSRE